MSILLPHLLPSSSKICIMQSSHLWLANDVCIKKKRWRGGSQGASARALNKEENHNFIFIIDQHFAFHVLFIILWLYIGKIFSALPPIMLWEGGPGPWILGLHGFSIYQHPMQTMHIKYKAIVTTCKNVCFIIGTIIMA